MDKYEHGGNIYVYDEDVIDFSSNINPFGFPECIKDSIDIADLTKYPDVNYTKLKNSISKYTGLKSENVIVGNSASELIYLFVRAFSIKKPLIPSPAFLEYERAATLSGGNPLYYRISEKNGYVIDVNEIANRFKEVDSVIIGNPNNPTGKAIKRKDVEYMVKEAKKLDLPVMIDEAFIEFICDYEEYQSLDLINDYDNLFIVRAATKFFGLPGLRLGYGFGSENLIKRLEAYKEPWTVNVFADTAGRKIFDDVKFMENTRKYIKEEIDYLTNELKKVDELVVFDTQVNFMLIKLKNRRVNDLKEELLKRGILIRDASNFRYLDDKYFRVAVKSHCDNVKLVESIKEVLK
ncbi:threonine-phosphate decarboxylase CobD [Thermoanaerobacterium thermosaccharolyticum]|uniref:threonine-phosphate decarboxylase CobD n=1 Tax=Thermoanaerobacterium thermosaccharolyticum TaxID=1517 RepID=UPI00177E63D8|nr:threonine-phosphate decarboxylase CobD [Thermoanaerobacterium thermosaccharolyticum]MBE0067932.1 threonine-phosphate decarboxylase [Thermoanaerobacterium thermosaccharolyticum]MBE0227671.1 threonine-phosphate decarboxylase [Thermoanaerobacterium thermosaccharolyticum]